jgi:hypothetical protein
MRRKLINKPSKKYFLSRVVKLVPKNRKYFFPINIKILIRKNIDDFLKKSDHKFL